MFNSVSLTVFMSDMVCTSAKKTSVWGTCIF